MKNKKGLFVGILVIIACLLLMPVSLLYFIQKNINNKTSRYDIRIENGQPVPDKTTCEFSINKTGEYTIHYGWKPEGIEDEDILKLSASDIPFITVINITNKDEVTEFATTAGAIFADTTLLLDEGEYTVTYYYFTDRESYLDYAKENLCCSKDAESIADGLNFDNIKDGTFTMSYDFNVSGQDSTGMFFLIIMVSISVMIIVLTVILMLVAKKPNYDERQEFERGRGFKFAFFTTLLSIAISLVLDSSNILPGVSSIVFYGTSIFAGLTVYVVYCIWNEAYIAPNQQKKSVMILFAIVIFTNIMISINNILNGNLIENGKIGFGFINILCVLTFSIVFFTLLIKNIYDKKARSEESDDE